MREAGSQHGPLVRRAREAGSQHGPLVIRARNTGSSSYGLATRTTRDTGRDPTGSRPAMPFLAVGAPPSALHRRRSTPLSRPPPHKSRT